MLDSNLGLVGQRTAASDTLAASAAPDGRTAPGAPRLEKFVYDDQIVRMFMTATIVWGLVAFLAGLIIALQMVLPIAAAWEVGGTKPLAFLAFLYQVEYLTFGRLRPLHTNAAIFAFAGNSIFTGVYYSVQRLCKARMWSDKLSRLHFWGWQGIIVAAALTLPLGITQGKEYAELEWPIDLAIAVVWLGFFGTNFTMTLVKRRERHMYVAIWFYIASLITVTVLHVFNNLWVPLAAVELLNGRVPSGATGSRAGRSMRARRTRSCSGGTGTTPWRSSSPRPSWA